MSSTNGSCCRTTLNWVGVLGAFVVMGVLVSALKHYTTVPSVNQARAVERLKIRDDARQKAKAELETTAYLGDKTNGIVRLPNSVATALAVKLGQDPAKARAELLARAAKAFYVPPPPPEPKSAFE